MLPCWYHPNAKDEEDGYKQAAAKTVNDRFFPIPPCVYTLEDNALVKMNDRWSIGFLVTILGACCGCGGYACVKSIYASDVEKDGSIPVLHGGREDRRGDLLNFEPTDPDRSTERRNDVMQPIE